MLAFEQRHGLGPAADGGDLIADALERPLEILAHRRVVFGQEDSRHCHFYDLIVCFLPEANNAFARCRSPMRVLNWHGI
jgi:hypothetical protein